MSAIGAIFSPDGVSADDLVTLRGSLGLSAHDDCKSWQNGSVALVAAIHHTTAESREQVQPLVREQDQLAIVFDGYLLNHDELAQDLKARGYPPRNRSEAEIALRAYEAWGDGFARRLEGEFACIIANLAQSRIVAATDHLGMVPLLYRLEGQRLIIASDLATIVRLARRPIEPDKRYLAQTVAAQWFLRDATPWKGVHRLVRAHTLTFDGHSLKASQYWSAPTDISIRYSRDEDYVEHYREMLFDCVKRSMRSDEPIGIAVSGGLDSSALFVIADKLKKDGLLPAPSIKGYALAAREETDAYETPYARAVAQHVGRDLTEVPLFDPDVEWYSRQAAEHYDIPIPANGAMLLKLEQQVANDDCRVVINGLGGDEWLQGSAQYYREMAAEGDVAALWQALRRDASEIGIARASKNAARQSLAELTPALPRRLIRKFLRERRRSNNSSLFWLKPEWREFILDLQDEYEASLPENAIEFVKHNLVSAPFRDLSSSLMRRQRAPIGLTSRHPMLSRAFIEFSYRTPAHIKRRGLLTKYVHRQAMEGLLPPEVLHRRSKASFHNPRIDAQFADFVREHGAEQLSEFCERKGLERLLEVDFAGREGNNWLWEIWGLYAIAAFLYQKGQINKS